MLVVIVVCVIHIVPHIHYVVNVSMIGYGVVVSDVRVGVLGLILPDMPDGGYVPTHAPGAPGAQNSGNSDALMGF